MKFYKVTTALVAEHQRKENQNNILLFVKTAYNKDPNKSYKWVINVGCGEELYPEIEWKTFEVIDLEIEDFPIEEL